MPSLLVYGSYGYVGQQVAQTATDRGLEVTLAGRDGDALDAQVDNLGRPGLRFALDDPSTVAQALTDVDCVLNCAGPFSNTAEPLVDGCLRSQTDYVDITGEIPVIEQIRGQDDAADNVGITLFPAAGFSAVPLDCLAAHLADRLPEATALALGVDSFRVPSIGSIKTVIEGIDTGGAVRRDGKLVRVPEAWRTRRIDFGRGARPAVTMPMGDVTVAHETTEVPNVETYAVMPQPAKLALYANRYLGPLFATTPIQRALQELADFVRNGPSERARQRGSAYLWGEARTDDDERVVSRLRTPDPYVVTVDAAVTVTERVLAGDTENGFQTPAGAFGSEFVFELDDVEGFADGESPPEAWPTGIEAQVGG